MISERYLQPLAGFWQDCASVTAPAPQQLPLMTLNLHSYGFHRTQVTGSSDKHPHGLSKLPWIDSWFALHLHTETSPS